MRGPDSLQRKGPLPAALGVPLSWIYRAAIGRINRRFDRRKGVVTFDRPVISIGNLSVGGTGKTPMVASIARWLLDAGHHPCIAMRGYGARHDGAGGESDEAAAYRRELPGVPVVARGNRTLGLIQLFATQHEEDSPHSDCIILDDGFQHRQIARDLDIVLVDATRDPFRDRLLPAGWLREPVESLQRAGAVVITHAESASAADVTAIDRRVGEIRAEGAIAVCRHAWSELVTRREGVDETLPVSWLSGKRVVAVCAIGNPEPFLAGVQRATGSAPAESVVLRDHDEYREVTARRIVETAAAARAQAIVTTEKDWSKLARVKAWPCPVVRARLEMGFDRGEESLRRLVQEAASRVHEEEIQGQGNARV